MLVSCNSYQKQERGGRWKPLHYFAVDFFAPLIFIIVDSPDDGSVAAYAHFDRREDLVAGTLAISVHSWDSMDNLFTVQVPIPLVNKSSAQEVTLDICNHSNVNNGLLFYLSQNIEPGQPVWKQQLSELLNRIGCSRETCLMTTSFTATSSSGLVTYPDNHLYLTSFPFVTNLQKANVQVLPEI